MKTGNLTQLRKHFTETPIKYFTGSHKYHLFRKAFSVNDSPVLTEFEKIFHYHRHVSIEPSIKVENGKTHACRFNVYFKKPYVTAGLTIFSELCDSLGHRFNISLDLSKIEFLLNSGLSLRNHCDTLIVGLDLRPQLDESRLKFWVITKPIIEKEVLVRTLKHINVKIDDFFVNNISILGVDIGFNATSRYKLYPYYRFSNVALESHIGMTTQEKLLTDFADGFYLEPLNSDQPFQARLSGKYLRYLMNDKFAQQLSPISSYIFSVPRNELRATSIRRFNLYF